MLVLARKRNQKIVIDGRIWINVVHVDGDCVKLSIEAPRSVPVFRQEIYNDIQANNDAALATDARKAILKKKIQTTTTKPA